nr:hypothetical protein [Chlamydiota bacterium]
MKAPTFIVFFSLLQTFVFLSKALSVSGAVALDGAINSANTGGTPTIDITANITDAQLVPFFEPLHASDVLTSVTGTADQDFTIQSDVAGTVRTLSGSGDYRGFFALKPTTSTVKVTIIDLEIMGAKAEGGTGAAGRGGGGIGAGGGLFLNSGAKVTLDNVRFTDCNATGGSGRGAGIQGGGGGGGGFARNGDVGSTGGGGGGGFNGKGGSGTTGPLEGNG